MADADLGKSDFDTADSLQQMLNTLYTMIEKTSLTAARMDEVRRAKERDRDMALCLDPKKIDAEFERIRKAAFQVGEDAEVGVKLNEARDHLSGWQGLAADAFRAHLKRFESFATQTQHETVLRAMQSLGALFAMAYHMRQSYYDLGVAVRAAAEHEIDEQHKRVDKLKLAIGVDFVKAAFSMDAKNLGGAGVDFALDAVGALGEFAIEGNDADYVIDEYIRRSNSLHDTFVSNLEQLSHRVWREWYDQVNTVDRELKVLEPLPVICDIDSPDFSYRNFYTEEYPKDGPFVGKVEGERKKVAEQHERDNKINKRLAGRE